MERLVILGWAGGNKESRVLADSYLVLIASVKGDRGGEVTGARHRRC